MLFLVGFVHIPPIIAGQNFQMFILNEVGHMYSSGVNMFLRYKGECEITAEELLEGTPLCTCFLPGQKSNTIINIYLFISRQTNNYQEISSSHPVLLLVLDFTSFFCRLALLNIWPLKSWKRLRRKQQLMINVATYGVLESFCKWSLTKWSFIDLINYISCSSLALTSSRRCQTHFKSLAVLVLIAN